MTAVCRVGHLSRMASATVVHLVLMKLMLGLVLVHEHGSSHIRSSGGSWDGGGELQIIEDASPSRADAQLVPVDPGESGREVGRVPLGRALVADFAAETALEM